MNCVTFVLQLALLARSAAAIDSATGSVASVGTSTTCDVETLIGHAKGLRCNQLRAMLSGDESCAQASDRSGRTALHWVGGNARIQGDMNTQEWEYFMGKSGFCTQILVAFAGTNAIWLQALLACYPCTGLRYGMES